MGLGLKNPKHHKDNPLICYCFGYTRNDLEQDFIKNGKSLIMGKIMAEKRLGRCQCVTNNPSGK